MFPQQQHPWKQQQQLKQRQQTLSETEIMLNKANGSVNICGESVVLKRLCDVETRHKALPNDKSFSLEMRQL